MQAAIDAVSALPLGASGYRGAVLLLRGHHEVTTPLLISSSGVVLRGEGSDRENGTLLVGVGPFTKTGAGYRDGVPVGDPAAGGAPPIHTARELLTGGLVRISGEKGARAVSGATVVPIIDAHVPLGERVLQLPPGAASAHFPVGSKVFVRRIGNEAWWNALELGPRAKGSSDYVHAHERTVVATEGDTITLDVGLVISIEERWGGGEVVACEESGRIFNVGVEDLRGVSEFDPSIVTDRFTNMDRPLREAEAIYGPDSAGYKGFPVRRRRLQQQLSIPLLLVAYWSVSLGYWCLIFVCCVFRSITQTKTTGTTLSTWTTFATVGYGGLQLSTS